MIKYIIIKVCCFDCKKFEDIRICNFETLGIFLRDTIEKKTNGEDTDNYYIYTSEGDLICRI